MPSRGSYWKIGGLVDGTVTGADIKNATIEAVDLAIFVSDIQTGTGSAQAVAHGLGVAPTKIIVSVYADANESTPTTVTEGSAEKSPEETKEGEKKTKEGDKKESEKAPTQKK